MSENPSTGQLIVFEGPDGVGKSTLSKALAEKLEETGIPCKHLSFPGRDPGTIGRLVYEIHHSPEKFEMRNISPISLQALHIAAHLEVIEQRIAPALKNGHWIVLDRFWWSTWVYGRTSSVNSSVLDALIQAERMQWDGVEPSIVLLIDRSDESFHNPDHTQLRKAYGILHEKESQRHPTRLIRNDASVEESMKQVLDALRDTGFQPQNDADGKHIGYSMNQPQLLHPLLMQKKLPYVFAKLSPARPTVVYDSYWRFAAERQEVFFRKLERPDGPWTDDPILRRHKFTNAYRASDRVSQYLIRHVIYEGDPSPEEVFFRTVLFKLFNKIETWEMLKSRLGTISYADYSFPRYDQILSDAISSGTRIYSAAYMMPSGKSAFGHARKHSNHLELIKRMMSDGVPLRIADAPNMRQAFELLRSYPTIGNFLAYQFITDLNYSEVVNFSEMEFVISGPGAIDGIHKCFSDLGGLNETDIIKLVTDRQEMEFERSGLDFRTLGGRSLQLIDCQNLFCEVSKYARLRHPDIKGVSKRTRIKQIYRPSAKPIEYWYPPKWNINHMIPGSGRAE